MKCLKCGTEAGKNDRFCANCGAKIEPAVKSGENTIELTLEPTIDINKLEEVSTEETANDGAESLFESNRLLNMPEPPKAPQAPVIPDDSEKPYLVSEADYRQSDYYQATTESTEPGKGSSIASLVLGILSILFWFFGIGAILGVIAGIVGLICSSKAKKAGITDGIQVAGFVCSLVGTIGSGLIFFSCVACVGTIGLMDTFL